MVVLVDGQTTAGELAASAIQQTHRGVVIGQRTSGLTALKNMEKNPDGSSQLVVMGQFYATRKQVISGEGVKPDIEVSSDMTEADVLNLAIKELRQSGKKK